MTGAHPSSQRESDRPEGRPGIDLPPLPAPGASSNPTVRKKAPLWFRLTALALGGLLLVWLPVEDSRPLEALLFGAALAGLVAVRILAAFPARPHTPTRSLLQDSLGGALAGLAAAPLAAFLMVFKSGLHAHPVPDFTPGQLLAVLKLAPIFALAGGLLGTGLGIVLSARKQVHR